MYWLPLNLALSITNISIVIDLWVVVLIAGTDFEYGELCWKGRHASAGGQRHHPRPWVSCQMLWRCFAWIEGPGYGQNLAFWEICFVQYGHKCWSFFLKVKYMNAFIKVAQREIRVNNRGNTTRDSSIHSWSGCNIEHFANWWAE